MGHARAACRLLIRVGAVRAAVAALGLVTVAAADANSVSPSCIPTLSTPVTLTGPPGTVGLGVGPAVFFGFGSPITAYQGTLTNFVDTPTGFTATATFTNFLIGDPTLTTGTGQVDLFLTGHGMLVFQDTLGPLQLGNCPPPLTRKQARVACRRERRTIGVPRSKPSTATRAVRATPGRTASLRRQPDPAPQRSSHHGLMGSRRSGGRGAELHDDPCGAPPSAPRARASQPRHVESSAPAGRCSEATRIVPELKHSTFVSNG